MVQSLPTGMAAFVQSSPIVAVKHEIVAFFAECLSLVVITANLC